ncbi:MAG: hypothetical protein V8Q79_06670 [Christensenellales bacterium]
MMERLSAGWRGRRVLLIGGENGLCGAMKSMMAQIGVRETCVGMDADAQTLCRALGRGGQARCFCWKSRKKAVCPNEQPPC